MAPLVASERQVDMESMDKQLIPLMEAIQTDIAIVNGPVRYLVHSTGTGRDAIIFTLVLCGCCRNDDAKRRMQEEADAAVPPPPSAPESERSQLNVSGSYAAGFDGPPSSKKVRNWFLLFRADKYPSVSN